MVARPILTSEPAKGCRRGPRRKPERLGRERPDRGYLRPTPPSPTRPGRVLCACHRLTSDHGAAYRGVDAGVPGPELAGGVPVAPEVGRERTRPSNVVAASTQSRMDSFWSHRTAKRVSPLWKKKPAP